MCQSLLAAAALTHFSHGAQLVITGAKNEDDALLAGRKLTRIMQKLGFNATLSEFRIQNLVASGDLGFPLRLEGIADEHRQHCSVRAMPRITPLRHPLTYHRACTVRAGVVRGPDLPPGRAACGGAAVCVGQGGGDGGQDTVSSGGGHGVVGASGAEAPKDPSGT